MRKESFSAIFGSPLLRISDMVVTDTLKRYARSCGRLQTENVKLKNNIEGQLISTDNKVRFYTGIPSKSLFLWMVTFCSAVLPKCKVMSPQSVLL
jgi:hypothetical protein